MTKTNKNQVILLGVYGAIINAVQQSTRDIDAVRPSTSMPLLTVDKVYEMIRENPECFPKVIELVRYPLPYYLVLQAVKSDGSNFKYLSPDYQKCPQIFCTALHSDPSQVFYVSVDILNTLQSHIPQRARDLLCQYSTLSAARQPSCIRGILKAFYFQSIMQMLYLQKDEKHFWHNWEREEIMNVVRARPIFCLIIPIDIMKDLCATYEEDMHIASTNLPPEIKERIKEYIKKPISKVNQMRRIARARQSLRISEDAALPSRNTYTSAFTLTQLLTTQRLTFGEWITCCMLKSLNSNSDEEQDSSSDSEDSKGDPFAVMKTFLRCFSFKKDEKKVIMENIWLENPYLIKHMQDCCDSKTLMELLVQHPILAQYIDFSQIPKVLENAIVKNGMVFVYLPAELQSTDLAERAAQHIEVFQWMTLKFLKMPSVAEIAIKAHPAALRAVHHSIAKEMEAFANSIGAPLGSMTE